MQSFFIKMNRFLKTKNTEKTKQPVEYSGNLVDGRKIIGTGFDKKDNQKYALLYLYQGEYGGVVYLVESGESQSNSKLAFSKINESVVKIYDIIIVGEKSIGWGSIIMEAFLNYVYEEGYEKVIGDFAPDEGIEELAEHFYIKHGFQIDKQTNKLSRITRKAPYK